MLEKINTYLNAKQKFFLLFVMVAFFVISFLEAISIASIPIFISYILKPDIFLDRIFDPQIKSFLIDHFTNNSKRELLSQGCILIFGIFLIKNIFSFLISLLAARTYRDIGCSVNVKLFQFYLFSNYNYHLNTNPSLILRNIMVSSVATNSITAFLIVFKQFLIILGLISLIIYSGLQSTISIVFVIFIILFLGYFFIHKILVKKSKEAANFQADQIKTINQFIGSIIDIKIKGKEKYFLDLYSKNIFQYEMIEFFLRIIKSIPKFLTEMLAISGLLFIVYFYAKNNTDLTELIPFLALVTLSLIRILPSIQDGISALTDIKFQKVYFDLIYGELKKLEKMDLDYLKKQKKDEYTFNKKILLKNIDFEYQDSNQRFLKNVSVEINKGKKTGIIGRSGSGKSTLLNIILGLLKPQSGKIEIDDQEAELEKNSRIVWKNLSYIPQDLYLLDDSILKNIAFGVEQKKIDLEKINKIIKICELEKFVKNQTEDVNTLIGNRGMRISGGQKQRLGFARALYSDPKILFIDEATSNMDSKTEDKMINNIFNSFKDMTIVAITHKLSRLKNFDNILVLDNGQVVEEGNFEKINKLFKEDELS